MNNECTCARFRNGNGWWERIGDCPSCSWSFIRQITLASWATLIQNKLSPKIPEFVSVHCWRFFIPFKNTSTRLLPWTCFNQSLNPPLIEQKKLLNFAWDATFFLTHCMLFFSKIVECSEIKIVWMLLFCYIVGKLCLKLMAATRLPWTKYSVKWRLPLKRLKNVRILKGFD